MNLREFLIESNRIEGISGVTPAVEEAAAAFLDLDVLTVVDVTRFVSVCQPNAVLRDKPNLNVRVGDHIAPRGGPSIPILLADLLDDINRGFRSPWDAHVKYETLHPYTDGNGRSGRIIWLWHMTNRDGGAPLGFLHHFYYQSLQNARKS